MALSPLLVATLVLVVAVPALVFAYFYVARDLDARLEQTGRDLGVNRWVATPAVLAAVLGVASVFVLGGTTTGRGDVPLALSAVLYVLGLFGVAVGVGNYQVYRRARTTETTPTGTVEPGFVELSGEVRPAGESAATPFAGTDAVCWTWRVEEYRSQGRRREWVTVAVGEGGVPFSLDDGSGPALVDPEGADLRLDAEATVEVGADEDPPGRVAAFLADRPDLGPGDRDRRYVETYLPPGVEGYVLGQAKSTFSGEYPDDDVVVATEWGTQLLVAAGTPENVTADLRQLVLLAGGGGLAATVAGYAGMLVTSGVV